jgi:hypothetical protein
VRFRIETQKKQQMEGQALLNSIRWIARVFGALLVLLSLVFFIGSFFEGLHKSTPPISIEFYNVMLLSLWGIGLASYILAWWKEGLGGMISFISLTLFNILAAFNPVEGSSYTPMLLLFIVPSLLHLICWNMNTR